MQNKRKPSNVIVEQQGSISKQEVSDVQQSKTGLNAGFALPPNETTAAKEPKQEHKIVKHDVDWTYIPDEEWALRSHRQIPFKKLSLPELTRRANDLHSTVMQGVRTTLIAAKDCGIALALCKRKVGHGSWTAWLKDSFAASEYTAQRYMRIARDWHLLEASGWLDGPDLPGIAMADEMIRNLHGGQKIPTSSKPPPSTRDELLKHITGTIRSFVRAWRDEAINLFDSQILAVMDSIEVYVQEQFCERQYPDVLPRIAIREHVGLMKLLRTFAARINELDEGEQAKLLQMLDKPSALRELVNDHVTPKATKDKPKLKVLPKSNKPAIPLTGAAE